MRFIVNCGLVIRSADTFIISRFHLFLLVSLLFPEDAIEFSLTTLSKRISERSSLEKECGACALFSLHRGKIIDCDDVIRKKGKFIWEIQQHKGHDQKSEIYQGIVFTSTQ